MACSEPVGPRIAFIDYFATHYRKRLYEELARRMDVDFYFFADERERYWNRKIPLVREGDFRRVELRRGAVGADDTAAAAWSWVEKMLQEAQRTSAPSAVSVSMSTAVWMVMCSEPAMRAPASGFAAAVALAHRHQAGHLVLGERDLGAAVVGQAQVGDLEVALGLRVHG